MQRTWRETGGAGGPCIAGVSAFIYAISLRAESTSPRVASWLANKATQTFAGDHWLLELLLITELLALDGQWLEPDLLANNWSLTPITPSPSLMTLRQNYPIRRT